MEALPTTKDPSCLTPPPSTPPPYATPPATSLPRPSLAVMQLAGGGWVAWVGIRRRGADGESSADSGLEGAKELMRGKGLDGVV